MRNKFCKRFSLAPLLLSGLCAAALSGCVTPSAGTAHSEDFGAANTYARSFPGSDKATCEAARRALLSQGYLVSEANASVVQGRKNFQPQSNQHVQIEFNVVCASNSRGSNSTTVFANAVRDTYSLKKTSNSASLGVSVLGSLSLPFGYTDDSLVKIASETIASKRFYDRFFSVVESYLDDPVGSGDEDKGNAKPGE